METQNPVTDQDRRCAQGHHADLVQGQCPNCLEFDLED